jgi:aminoglycoside 3-N-acetyltransferase
MEQRVPAPSDLRAGIRQLGLSGLPLCVHSSLRSFGIGLRVEATEIVRAVLDEGCTLMVPSFSDDFAVWPPVEQQPPRNGWNYDRPRTPYPGERRIYTPDVTEVTVAEMGVLSATVAAWPGRRRGEHPLISFSAIGPLADALIAPQRPLDVFAPFRELAARDGQVLLIGVGLTDMTLLHHAEEVAGRQLFRRWANGADGRPMQVQSGGCSNGFTSFEPLLAPLAREMRVGASPWRAFPAAETIAGAAAAIRAQPSITACANPRCERCRDAVRGGPLV